MKKFIYSLNIYLFVNILFLLMPSSVGYIDIEWRLPVQQIIVIPVTAIMLLLPYAIQDIRNKKGRQHDTDLYQ